MADFSDLLTTALAGIVQSWYGPVSPGPAPVAKAPAGPVSPGPGPVSPGPGPVCPGPVSPGPGPVSPGPVSPGPGPVSPGPGPVSPGPADTAEDQAPVAPEPAPKPQPLVGIWTELARTPNTVHKDEVKPFVHEFVANGEDLVYTLDGVTKTLTKVGDRTYQVAGEDEMLMAAGMYDKDLQPDPVTPAYVILTQGDKAWILARKGTIRDLGAANKLVSQVKSVGYVLGVYHPEFQPDDHVVVHWSPDNFPEDGKGVDIKIPPGGTLRFVSPKDQMHTVAQANSQWRPHPSPTIATLPQGKGFCKTLAIREPGIYHLVCPLGDNHKKMRLRVHVA